MFNLRLFCVISMFVSERMLISKDVFKEFYMYLGTERGGGYTNAFICMGTYSRPLLQNRLKDVYETW